MQKFNNKLYNYEAQPPEKIWSNILSELNDQKIVEMPALRKRSKFLFYGLTAAASLLIIFAGSLFFNKNTDTNLVVKNSSSKATNLINQKIKDSIALNHQILESIINTPQDKKILASNFERQAGKSKKYITIAGPEGQPVKISPKAATLILSADNEYPPKPVWNKKIEKWKQIMLSNMTAPTSSNLVDILQLAANKENVE